MPEIWTCAVLVMLPRITEERDEEGPLLSTTTNSKPAKMPTITAGMKSAKPRGREAVEHWSP